MKFDDAAWHYQGDFPEHLPNSAAFTHIGMFLAWILLHDFGGELHEDEFSKELSRLKARTITPGVYFETVCDGKFTDEDCSQSIFDFVNWYYSEFYLADYVNEFEDEVESIYEVGDNWKNYDRISSRLNARYSEWQSSKE